MHYRSRLPAILLVIVAVAVGIAFAKKVTLSVNVRHLYDTEGRIVNAHDGSLIYINGTFYLYGTVYEMCKQGQPICHSPCGFVNNTFALYTSPDMSNGSWTRRSTNLVPAFDKDKNVTSYWMANVGYNNKTKMWVMAYWSGHYGFVNNMIAVATSAVPEGPFANQPPLVVTGSGTVISSTTGMIVDYDTGKAYVRYNTRDTPLRHVVEELDDTWLRTSGKSSIVIKKQTYPWYEGGGMFKRNGLFYVMIGTDCCYCQWGSDALVFVASDPVGTWTPQTRSSIAGMNVQRNEELAPGATQPPANWSNEVNFCANGLEPPAHITGGMGQNVCSQDNVSGTNFTIPAQQFYVAAIPSSKPGEYTYMYWGEHYNSAPDGYKAHDLVSWIPLEFEGNRILPMRWKDSIDIDVP